MDDLISRQAALEKVRTMQTYKLSEGDDMILVDKTDVQTELMMLPPVQPEVLACGSGELVAKPELTDEQVIDYCGKKGYKIVADDLFDLLSKSEPQWIPVSERFPEDYADVLVWFEYFRYGDYNCMYATHGIGNYSKEYNSWTINHESGWKDLRVIAWMPLPEPYKPNK